MKDIKRNFRINNLITVIMVFAIIVIVNLMSSYYFIHIDVTETSLNSLNDSTIKILNKVKKPLYIQVFFKSNSQGYGFLREHLSEYEIVNRKVKIDFIDPDLSPKKALEYGVSNDMIVLVYGNGADAKREDVYSYSEEKISSAIQKLVINKEPVLYFLQGHGEKKIDTYEPESFSKINDFLKESNYLTKKLLLSETHKVPEDCDVLIIASPKKELLKEELQSIKDYFDNSGKILLLLDTEFEQGVKMKELAYYLGVYVEDGIIFDGGANLNGDPSIPAGKEYKPHYITDNLAQTVFPLVRPLYESKSKPEGDYLVEELIKSDKRKSYIELSKELNDKTLPDKDEDIMRDAAMVVSSKKIAAKKEQAGYKNIDARAVVIGDATFATDNFVDFVANSDLIYNSIEWLTADSNVVAVRDSDVNVKRFITLTNLAKSKILWICVVIIPLLFVLIGILVVYRREKSE